MNNVSIDRIGKWKERADEWRGAIAIGAPLLRELGYLQEEADTADELAAAR